MNKKIVLVLLLLILVFLFTFPLFLRTNSCISGTFTTDEPFAALFNFWWLKYSFVHHFNDAYYSTIAVPFGMDAKSGYPLWNAINKCLSVLTNHIFAYNLETIFSFFAAGLFMFYLVSGLTKNVMAGIFSAIIYAFCPYHFARAWQHLGLAQIQWIPLYIFALLRLKERPNLKHSILVAAAFFLIFSFDLYYAYFMFIITFLFILFLFVYKWRIKLKEFSYFQKEWYRIKMIFISGILAFFLTLPLTVPIFKDHLKSIRDKRPASVFNAYHRPFEDLFSQSARPLSYFLPASVHPIFGKFTENFIGSSLYGDSFTEHTLYLGWTPLVLAFIAFRRWRKERKQVDNSGTVPFRDSPYHNEDFYIGFFVFLAIVAWFFSQPPWWNIGTIKIFMPSFFMYKIVPMFRAYCRFGIVLMLAVAVLAGFGLKFILDKFKGQKAKVAITSLFCGLVLFEFWNYPPFKVIDVSRAPDVYYWLKEQPGDFAIAEYPLDADSPNEMYKFYQTTHEKKIINGTIPGTYANKVAQSIVKLSETKTIDTLERMGVKYILIHHDAYLQTDLVEDKEELDKIPKNPRLKLIKTFPVQDCPQKDIMCVRKTGPIDIYEVQ